MKDTLSDEAKDLLAQMFNTKADDRPSARDLLNHPWFSSEQST
jgi:serine/threonine protein kinase